MGAMSHAVLFLVPACAALEIRGATKLEKRVAAYNARTGAGERFKGR